MPPTLRIAKIATIASIPTKVDAITCPEHTPLLISKLANSEHFLSNSLNVTPSLLYLTAILLGNFSTCFLNSPVIVSLLLKSLTRFSK